MRGNIVGVHRLLLAVDIELQGSAIRTQHLTVKEAAYALRFNEASSFCRFFKRVTGQTPQQFRAGLESL